jgi:Domain of unknown function (DUF4166)
MPADPVICLNRNRSSATCSPYQAILGDAFALVHAHVQRAHLAPLAAEGTVDVEHGSHWLAPLLIRLMKLPGAGRGQHVRLDVVVAGDEVEWRRQIGSSVLRTRQKAIGSRLLERSGIGCVAFELAVKDGALLYRQVAMSVAGMQIPSSMSPRVQARVSPAATGWHVEVVVTWRTHLLCRYAGVVGSV